MPQAPTVQTPDGSSPIDGAFNPQTQAFQPAHLPATTAMISSNTATSGTTPSEAAEIVPFSASRRSVTICNRTTGAETIDIGPVGVTVGGGIPIVAGGDRTLTGPGAAGPIYAISPAASTPISWVEC